MLSFLLSGISFGKYILLHGTFEDNKGGIRSRYPKKDRQYNGQKKNDKRTNKDLQNITQKTKNRATRTPLKTGSELRCPGRVGSS